MGVHLAAVHAQVAILAGPVEQVVGDALDQGAVGGGAGHIAHGQERQAAEGGNARVAPGRLAVEGAGLGLAAGEEGQSAADGAVDALVARLVVRGRQACRTRQQQDRQQDEAPAPRVRHAVHCNSFSRASSRK